MYLQITIRGKDYPTEIFIDQKANLPKPSFIQAANLHPVPKNRLGKYLGTLEPDIMCDVSRKIALALELENSLFKH